MYPKRQTYHANHPLRRLEQQTLMSKDLMTQSISELGISLQIAKTKFQSTATYHHWLSKMHISPLVAEYLIQLSTHQGDNDPYLSLDILARLLTMHLAKTQNYLQETLIPRRSQEGIVNEVKELMGYGS